MKDKVTSGRWRLHNMLNEFTSLAKFADVNRAAEDWSE